jgi:2-polyprenyl-3-methyl-5-hydroxy-6-metoxy-1,4-benzoquinol methylase
MKILALLLFSFSIFATNKFEILTGDTKSLDDKLFWDKKYSDKSYVFGKIPARFLSENFHYIPAGARVLDLGMGEGRNAVFLARKGFNVTGIDISSVAVRKAQLLAKEVGVRIEGVTIPVEEYRPPKELFDAVICFYYVDRKLNEKILSYLKPGGLLIYEAHTDKQKTIKGNEKYESQYLLRSQELLGMFKKMRILKYEEPIHQGEYTASIILKKE